MSVINVLDKKVYNRISAGEVVERPSSIVKELVENSIDAGASEISVIIDHGGISSITVQDNGKGLEQSQLAKVFLPHATSKISKAEDLDAIMTLGFRGEALASIGAVTRSTFISKTQEQEVGAAIDCEGGETGNVYDYPALTGTTVICRDLFFNTPARCKFLKTPKSEENEIVVLLTKIALSHPEIAFSLTCDNESRLKTYGDGLEECLASVYGIKTLENCYAVEREKNGITVSGYIGKLDFTKPTRAFQTLIVNGRFVTDNTVSSAVMNAYGSYLMKRQYPFYVLNLTIPPEAVDVNVHPRKAEVRFSDNRIVYGAVYSTVSAVLDGSSSAIEIVKDDGFAAPEKVPETFTSSEKLSVLDEKKTAAQNIELSKCEQQSDISVTSAMLGDMQDKTQKDDGIKDFVCESIPNPFNFSDKKKGFSYAGANKGETVKVSDSIIGDNTENLSPDDIFAENKRYIEKMEKEKALQMQQIIAVEPVMFYIGQAFNTYLIFQYDDDLYMIDQHAAHERLLYDEFCEKAKSGVIAKQTLLLPYVFKVSREDFDSIYQRYQYFRQLGIEIDNVGDDTFKISAVPSELCNINLKEFFDDILYDDSFKQETIPLTLKEKLMQKACKHAIKGGDSLTRSEIDALMAKLKGNFGLKCPHGRPIAVKISRSEIEKWFKRIV